jgi:hypothetical protein
MAFSVTEAHELEAERCHAVLRHHDQLLTVVLDCSRSVALRLPQEFTAELDYTSVVRFEVDLPPDDNQSGLFATDDEVVVLADGRVHNHLEIGPDHILVDVYCQTGPEFFTVTSEELGGRIPAIGSRLRVWLLGLTVYPTQT